MSAAARCERCDREMATEADWKHCNGNACASCSAKCWDGPGGYCKLPAVDWRARCLAAEARQSDMFSADLVTVTDVAAWLTARAAALEAESRSNVLPAAFLRHAAEAWRSGAWRKP